tara:strand:+ start:9481 stop:9609 length:129 start_codon:yes stop_codon:yes gene_type:complete
MSQPSDQHVDAYAKRLEALMKAAQERIRKEKEDGKEKTNGTK